MHSKGLVPSGAGPARQKVESVRESTGLPSAVISTSFRPADPTGTHKARPANPSPVYGVRWTPPESENRTGMHTTQFAVQASTTCGQRLRVWRIFLRLDRRVGIGQRLRNGWRFAAGGELQWRGDSKLRRLRRNRLYRHDETAIIRDVGVGHAGSVEGPSTGSEQAPPGRSIQCSGVMCRWLGSACRQKA